MPYYIGKFSMRERSFPQDLNFSAIAEILEKLAQFEDIAEKEQEDINGEDNS